METMTSLRVTTTALVIIDVQKAFDTWEKNGRTRNNPDAIERIVDLLDVFRRLGAPVIHVRHASLRSGSFFGMGEPGFAAKDEVVERAGEHVVVKNVNSAFISTDLEATLRCKSVDTLVLVGATTNHCVDSAMRHGSNLGFDTHIVRDATWAFDRQGVDGERYSPDQVHAMALASLNGEFGYVLTAGQVEAAITKG